MMTNLTLLDVLVEARQSELIKQSQRTGRKFFGRRS